MAKKYLEIQDYSELSAAADSSGLLIFKHSTRCPVSLAALEEFKSYLSTDPDVICAYVDVVNNRSVSNQIAEQFKIIHESPQILLIRKGLVVFHASHRKITKDLLHKAVNNQI